ncbi:hypothetical protein CS537_19870 [Yersinia mollaretii]|nr:hypothetical protein CS537_19870 [Yersinia mollaretii]
MSLWGAQLFMPGGTFDVINSFLPAYMMDYFTGSNSGSRSYIVPEGKSLKAKAYFTTAGSFATAAVISVSGGTVSWSNAAGNSIIVWVV